MHETWLQLSREGLLLAGVPFLATAMLVFLLRPLAFRFGLVDHPHNERKIHAIPTPLIGGAAIALAALCGGFFLLPHTKDLMALGAATLLLLAVGTLDDRYDIDWRIRIVAQSAAAVVLFQFGGVKVESIGNAFGIVGHTLGVLSLPFTILATVGLTNAVNLADGPVGFRPGADGRLRDGLPGL
jgi:UDP-GlcNAc:undecaprenyl-phosphate GlcNAc-1-phosphate transferase